MILDTIVAYFESDYYVDLFHIIISMFHTFLVHIYK
jgi:hypothetical protein